MRLFGRELTTEQAIAFVMTSKEDAAHCAKNCLIAEAAIQIAEDYSKLRTELATLRTELERVAEERDAAVADFKEYASRNISGTHGVYACGFCKHRTSDYDCKKTPCDGLLNWQWRGADWEENQHE